MEQAKALRPALSTSQGEAKRRTGLRAWLATGSFDIVFFVLVIALLTIGVIMMFSASYVSASYDRDAGYDALYYFKKQLLFAVLGVVVMLFVSRVNYKVFRKFAIFALVVSSLLLVIVLIDPVVIPGKESFKRWLEIPGVTTYQPSEIAKMALVLFLAYDMEKNQKKIDKDANMFWRYILVIGGMSLLVALENHLSGTILIFGIGIVVTFLGGIKARWYVIGIIGVVAVVLYFVINPDALPAYAADRIEAWTNKEADPLGVRWQTNQSLYAIGSGGLFGLGIGNSKQKHLYMPEPQNDFVFSIVCEELGFIRVMLIVLLFILLIWRGFVIAMKAKDRFGSLLCMGIVFQVGLQTALNIAVVTDTVPNTGISLPFFSYGGTSLLMLLFEMGMVLAVSRYSKINKS